MLDAKRPLGVLAVEFGNPLDARRNFDRCRALFPMAQVENAAGAIRTDVGWRDRRLVLQSDSLAIVCPKPPGEDRITRGVNEEIQTAVPLGIVCNLWQNPAWDPDDFVGKTFPPAGSMGIGHTQASVRKVGSLEELIRTNP